jgi:type I restriction enzyme M protein
MTQTSNNLASDSWAIADLLRGDFKQSQYGRIILPFCLLRRLECVLEATKDAVLAEYEKVQAMNLPEEAQEKLLLRATKVGEHQLSFYNTSKMDLFKLLKAVSKPTWKAIFKVFPKMRVRFLNTSTSPNLSVN